MADRKLFLGFTVITAVTLSVLSYNLVNKAYGGYTVHKAQRNNIGITTQGNKEERNEMRITTPGYKEERNEMRITAPGNKEESNELRITAPANKERNEMRLTTPRNEKIRDLNQAPRNNNSTITACNKEIRHLYFLKISKSSSTSVFNLFSRFARKRDLYVLTIFHDERIMSYPDRTFDELLPVPPPKGLFNGKYDMYLEHSVYDEDYLQTKLQPDTMNIAIMREPWSKFLSAFEFYDWETKFGLDNDTDPIARFLERPGFYETHYPDPKKRNVHDRVAMVFGYRPEDHDLEEYLRYIDSKFLVLITERLAESLVIMKRRLCWDFKDILIPHGRKQSYEKPTNATLIELHKSWSPVDYAFYDYFSRVMAELIGAQDNDFAGEVAMFKDYLAKTREFCDGICGRMKRFAHRLEVDRVSITAIMNTTTRFAATRWSSEFHVSGLDCVLMRAGPGVFRGMQKVQLFPEYCDPEVRKRREFRNIRHVDEAYCTDLFEGLIPWKVLAKGQFVDACY